MNLQTKTMKFDLKIIDPQATRKRKKIISQNKKLHREIADFNTSKGGGKYARRLRTLNGNLLLEELKDTLVVWRKT